MVVLSNIPSAFPRYTSQAPAVKLGPCTCLWLMAVIGSEVCYSLYLRYLKVDEFPILSAPLHQQP